MITDNTSSVVSNIKQRGSVFLRNVAEEIVSESTSRTPKKTGELRRDVLKQVLGLKGKVAWNKKYASIQETKQFRNYTTPGTGPKFAENAVRKVVGKANVIAKRSGLI